MKVQSLVIGALLAAAAVPASAVTVVSTFTAAAAGTNVVSVANTTPYFTLTVSAARFSVLPNALTNISQVTTPSGAQITRNIAGLGVNTAGIGSQMDTNTANNREAFRVTGNKAFYLSGLSLANVDQDDSLQIYGIRANGTLRNFTFGSGFITTNNAAGRTAGAIVGGAGGSLLNNTRNASLNGGTNTFGTGIVSGVGREIFTSYLITTRVGGDVQYLGTSGQGFTLSALTATVPEPATWAMLLVGFGLVGFARRRSVRTVAA